MNSYEHDMHASQKFHHQCQLCVCVYRGSGGVFESINLTNNVINPLGMHKYSHKSACILLHVDTWILYGLRMVNIRLRFRCSHTNISAASLVFVCVWYDYCCCFVCLFVCLMWLFFSYIIQLLHLVQEISFIYLFVGCCCCYFANVDSFFMKSLPFFNFIAYNL